LEPLAEFTQGGVWSRLHEALHHRETAGINLGRIAPAMGLGSDAARFTVLFEQSAYKAQADPKGGGQSPHGPFAVFIGLDDPYP
jgi:hypothetical protein